jgi:hypothetical protein
VRDARSAGQPGRETQIADYARSGSGRDLSDPGAVPGASTTISTSYESQSVAPGSGFPGVDRTEDGLADERPSPDPRGLGCPLLSGCPAWGSLAADAVFRANRVAASLVVV